MSNVGYDLDTSGGLMPLIRALIKPPDEEPVAPKSKKPQHPYYKRPGKGHNHDSCDACSEGGDLICCDRCPASFHLGCYDPPLDENDIPAGLWLCKECRASDAEMPASTKSSRAQSPADNKSDTEKKTRSLRNSSTSSKAKSKEDETEVKEELEGDKELSPMEILVKAAKIMNPRQFELPREMRVPCLFPGTEKEGGASLVTVDGSGCVPLPAASCFVCGGSCKAAPLLQCDYCPLLFHQDCLDPPLTALPTGRWMCPNHVEQYIDWKLVNSISATERVALWDKFSGPVDQHAIKLDFIRRARTAAPAFRMKIPVRGRQVVDVPAMVRHHYRRPPPLLPSRREYLRCTNVLRNLKARGAYSSSSEGSGDEGKHGICMNLQCPEYTGGRCPRLAPACPLRGATHEDAADDLDAIDANKQEKQSDDDSLSDLSDSDFEYLTAAVKRRKLSISSERSPKKRPERLELRDEGDAEALLAAVDNQLKKLDERLVKLLAWQRLQQVLAGEQAAGAWRGCGVSARAAGCVARSLGGGRLARLGLCPPALPSQLLTRADRERIARVVWGAPPYAPRPRAPPARPAPRDAAVRATLCAVPPPNRNGTLASLGSPIPMRLSTLSVGADSGCDVRLDPTLCRYVSRNHAIIFMDEVTRHFELINYSEWGSQVNGVMYTCDVTRPLPEPPERPFRTNINAPQPHRINGDLTKPIKNESVCRCGSRAAAAAWEGSALLPHGALLHFGCLMYVFSITDSQAFPYNTPTDDPAL